MECSLRLANLMITLQNNEHNKYMYIYKTWYTSQKLTLLGMTTLQLRNKECLLHLVYLHFHIENQSA